MNPGRVHVAERDAARAATSSRSRSAARPSRSRSRGGRSTSPSRSPARSRCSRCPTTGRPASRAAASAARPSPTSWATTSASPTSTPAPRTAGAQGPRPGPVHAAAGASWSMMSWEEQFPQPTVVEKMMLGWVKAAHVRNLSFATLGPVDEEIGCTPATSAPRPPAATRSPRSASPTGVTTTSSTVASGRRRSRTRTCRPTAPSSAPTACPAMEPSDRRNILRIRNDSDTDRAEFQLGDDYEETDTSIRVVPERLQDGGARDRRRLRPDPHHLRRREAGSADPAVGAEHQLEEPRPPGHERPQPRRQLVPRHPVGGPRQPHRGDGAQPRASSTPSTCEWTSS